ncbi:MAG: hypothetical protein ACO3SH_09670, partial [Candidatus Puniceispirillaceae bacterium]
CMDSGVQKPIGLSEAEITAFTDKALFESALARKSEPKKLLWVTNPTAFVRRALSGTIITMLIGAVIGAAITISSMWVLA